MDPNPIQRLRKAQALNELKRYAAAEAEVRQALAGDVDRCAAFACLAMALLGQVKLDEAGEAAGKAIAENPFIAHNYYLRAVVLRLTGALREAEAAARKALSILPMVAIFYAELAFILLERDNRAAHQEALALVEQGKRFDPHCVVLYQAHIKCLIRGGKFREARECALETVKLDPENSGSFFLLGNVEFLRNDFPAAEKHLRQALRLNPTAQKVKDFLLVTLRAQTWLYPDLRLKWKAGVNWLELTKLLIFIPQFIALRLMLTFTLHGFLFAATLTAVSTWMVILGVYPASFFLPIANFSLWLKPANRTLLPRREFRCAQAIVALMVTGLVLFGASMFYHWRVFGPLGVAALSLCAPVLGLLQPGVRKDKYLVIYACGIIGANAFLVAAACFGSGWMVAVPTLLSIFGALRFCDRFNFVELARDTRSEVKIVM